MYIILFAVFMLLGGGLLFLGIERAKRGPVVTGLFLLLGTPLFFGLLSFWGEVLWFEALGYEHRFWLFVSVQVGLPMLSAVLGGLGVFVLTLPLPHQALWARLWPVLGGAALGTLWGVGHWQTVLQYLNRVSTAVRDPILQRDTGFYLFTLPFYDALYWGLLGVSGLALFVILFSLFGQNGGAGAGSGGPDRADRLASAYRLLVLPVGVLSLLIAWGKYLNTYHLLYSNWGAVTGAGWTDTHIRLPAYLIATGATLLLGLLPLIPALHHRCCGWLKGTVPQEFTSLFALSLPWLGILGTWGVALGIAPGLVQWLRVSPNEITLEAPYISHNIQFTRQGFHLDKIEEQQFPVSHTFDQETLERNQHLLSEVRLWDWRALDAVYQQFQEIRLYYEFADVDIDRYRLGEGYRQVMVSAREMEPANLPQQSQTFVNQRFKYTHGYGITLAPVSEFTSDGLPQLFVKDIPPQTDYATLQVQQPQIYYGELTDSHVVVNTREAEFDYPSGEENVYIRYPGTGGVQLSNLWRTFLFGWKFDGTRLFFSSYPTANSRILFHRQIRERVTTLAPFLTFDQDPYIVLVDGKLYWMLDGYTTSTSYPYSEPFSAAEVIEYEQGQRTRTMLNQAAVSLHGVNYVRNAVKVVVDAFSGAVTFYVFEPEDPIIQVWQRILPGFFKTKSEMPAGLRAHVRYPVDFLLAQGLVYAKYHMTDPAVFYNQEDLWVRATEKYYAGLQPVEPYYIMWEPPDSEAVEFVSILPFTPKNRQVLIGWIAGMCDADNYGRLLAYKFPKEERVLGTQQVETKIDQDRFLSGQLSLWDQRGSKVIRGNVLAIPINKTLLYVEPIYLQAETAAYPELRLVAVMHGDDLSYAESLDAALRGLFEQKGKELPALEATGETVPSAELSRRAKQAFENYLQLQSEKQFTAAARELDTLQQTLQQLADQGR